MNGNRTNPPLDDRLSSALGFVRPGGVVLDVGTDHAYLPIAALLSGKCVRAVASDINEGPLQRAKTNGELCGVGDRLRYYLSDGLDGVEPEKNGVTDIVICGMGGELIARIIDDSAYTRQAGVRLILQPMTMAHVLRQYLTEQGFSILDEALSRSAGKIYTCISAEYTGGAETYTEAELLLGRCNIQRGGALFGEYCGRELTKLERRIAGLKTGGHDAAREEELFSTIYKIKEENHRNLEE